MKSMKTVLLAGWCFVVAVATVGCEDWTRLEVTPDAQSTAAVAAVATPAVTNAEAAVETTETAAAVDAPTPSGSLGVTGEGGGFLWKPASESSGRLVVLLPEQYTGSISTVFIAERDGTVVEVGSFRGIFNGGRAHYDFSSPGVAYGTAIYVVADLVDGTTHHWYVASGASRTEY